MQFELNDIVDLEILQEMQDAFSEVTNLAIIIVDYKGNPITRYSKFTDHCNFLRENKQCRSLCFDSDALAGVKSARKLEPYIFRCYAGLVDLAIPIIFNNYLVGSVLAGQVRVREDLNNNCLSSYYSENILDEKEDVDYIINDERRINLFNKTPVLTVEEIEKASKMIHVFCNYIVEMAVSKNAQNELQRKNVEIKLEMEERLDMEKSLREAEVKILKSQVNPHFLFNILNNLKNLAMIEGAGNTAEMIFVFTDMLRYTMGASGEKVTIRDELEYARDYLKIQKMRFGENLNYFINYDEDLLDTQCPFLIIQPLVANGIEHGIFKAKSFGNININITKELNNIVISVEDDGAGMEQDVINKVFSSIDNRVDSETGMGIGLINIHRRLQYKYGINYGLKIESLINNYTKVIIEIPHSEV